MARFNYIRANNEEEVELALNRWGENRVVERYTIKIAGDKIHGYTIFYDTELDWWQYYGYTNYEDFKKNPPEGWNKTLRY